MYEYMIIKKIKWRKAIISADILYLFLTFWKICLVFTLRGKPKTNQDLASALYSTRSVHIFTIYKGCKLHIFISSSSLAILHAFFNLIAI